MACLVILAQRTRAHITCNRGGRRLVFSILLGLAARAAAGVSDGSEVVCPTRHGPSHVIFDGCGMHSGTLLQFSFALDCVHGGAGIYGDSGRDLSSKAGLAGYTHTPEVHIDTRVDYHMHANVRTYDLVSARWVVKSQALQCVRAPSVFVKSSQEIMFSTCCEVKRRRYRIVHQNR